MDIELYRKQYDFELDQRIHLASNANIPIAGATVLFGAVARRSIDWLEDSLTSLSEDKLDEHIFIFAE
jgi:hypothetical protein